MKTADSRTAGAGGSLGLGVQGFNLEHYINLADEKYSELHTLKVKLQTERLGFKQVGKQGRGQEQPLQLRVHFELRGLLARS